MCVCVCKESNIHTRTPIFSLSLSLSLTHTHTHTHFAEKVRESSLMFVHFRMFRTLVDLSNYGYLRIVCCCFLSCKAL